MKRGTPDHPKTSNLIRRLGCPKLVAVGVLEMLWHFTSRFAPQGDIGRWTNEEIALGVGWEGNPDELISGLVAARWLDQSGDHRLVVHDWHDHADDTTKKALARRRLPVLSRLVQTTAGHVAKDPDDGGTGPENGGLPEPEPEPEPEPQPRRETGVVVATPEPDTPEATTGEPAYVPVEVLRCPDCTAIAVIRQNSRFGTGWVCDKRRHGGCGMVFAARTPPLLAQLPARQVEAVLRSVDRMEGRGPAPPEPEPPEDPHLWNADQLAAEFVAWLPEHQLAGELPGQAYVRWREAKGITNGAAAVRIMAITQGLLTRPLEAAG